MFFTEAYERHSGVFILADHLVFDNIVEQGRSRTIKALSLCSCQLCVVQ